MGAGGKHYALARTNEVLGQATQLEPGFCHVQLTADVRRERAVRIQGALVIAGLGIAATVAAIPLGVLLPWAYLPAPILALLGLVVTRRHRAENEKIQVGLEQVLDRLERGEVRAERALPGPSASPIVRIADEIRKALK